MVCLFSFQIRGLGKPMQCLHDGAEMLHVIRHGIEIDHCPQCGGVWLDRGELDKMIEILRPPVVLEGPAPVSAPRRSRPVVQPAPGSREAEKDRTAPSTKARAKPYGGRYSRKALIENILEEIFDFD